MRQLSYNEKLLQAAVLKQASDDLCQLFNSEIVDCNFKFGYWVQGEYQQIEFEFSQPFQDVSAEISELPPCIKDFIQSLFNWHRYQFLTLKEIINNGNQ